MTAEPVAGPAAPRLLALRLQGFKSFAERTHVEFGGGISAIVGPNGSGKSNLADALRWALGEQGRALRSRKAEDVIWAGSETRAAQGMADVTLVLDNADALLPVDFGVLELGRRLFRSGENEYLLNKQRIRLRDLVDLLDAAHLADNAFLFIGQGMVDQALALRPEERRPLFEEVAGVRRHERRRRKAEEQLTESEANLARVEDILAELRPQARRLAAQAEQQATRSTAGDELAAALVQAAHARWHGAAARHAEANRTVAESRRNADAAMAELDAAETAAGALSAELAVRATLEAERRAAHDEARAALTALQLRDGRLAAELEALQRDERRLADERAAAEAEATAQRRQVAAPVPARDLDLEAAVAAADRDLADALAELGTLRAAQHADGEALAAVRRAESARAAEAETARRRLDDAVRRLDEQRAVVSSTDARRVSVAARHDTARAALDAASAAELEAAERRESARLALETADAERDTAADRAAKAATAAAALRGRVDALTAQVDDDERRPIAKAARRVGGRRLDEDLVVEHDLRAAVEAALADRVRAYLVATSSVGALATERGRLLVDEVVGRELPTHDAATRRWLDAVASAGGGPLVDAVRRDGTGVTRRLLARVVWTPDLPTALDLQPLMPAGWLAVTRDGTAVVDETGVLLGAPESTLERLAEHGRLTGELDTADAEAVRLRTAADATGAAAADARRALETAGEDERRHTAERRRAEELERAAAREVEASARESAWHAAQLERGEAEVTRLRAEVAAHAPATNQATADTAGPGPAAAPDGAPSTTGALAAWEARAGELRERRDRLAGQLAAVEEQRRAAGHAQARAEAAAALADERLSRTEREAAGLADRRSVTTADRDAVRLQLAAATATEVTAREALAEVHAADAADRTRLADAEQTASATRERLRSADDRLRAADHAELEARLALEALREGVLVELAGLGPLGLAALGWTGAPGSARQPDPDESRLQPGPPPRLDGGGADTADGTDGTESSDDVAIETAELEAALTVAAEAWASEPPPAAPPPGRLAQLRRRYHDLGAANPFAVEEYAELKARLELLEAQDADLRAAIVTTRELIAQLDTMIADQFRRTFEALEGAFERRFEQLFGGGFARLALTDPSDLSSTGIEIIARPPGKKPQALAMLSGGERALTAVALLFAMLEVRPVPFCVLDEVDAALDEANIGRFAEALRSLADATQFIVITHNRGTIEAADAMYGVTVGDDSVSRVISLRLDEAQALADDRRRELAPAG